MAPPSLSYKKSGSVGPRLLVGGPSGLLDFVLLVLVLEGGGSGSVMVHGVQELRILVVGLKATIAWNSME